MYHQGGASGVQTDAGSDLVCGGGLATGKIALSYVGGQHNSGTLVAVLPALSSEATQHSLSLNVSVSPQLDWNSLSVFLRKTAKSAPAGCH